jgi:hypothetical protein
MQGSPRFGVQNALDQLARDLAPGREPPLPQLRVEPELFWFQRWPKLREARVPQSPAWVLP